MKILPQQIISTAVTHIVTSPPHYIAGLSLGEWVSVVTILSAMCAMVGVLFKYAVFAPLQRDIHELSLNLAALTASLTKLQDDYDHLEERVDEHDRRLDRHHEQIKTLYNMEGK